VPFAISRSTISCCVVQAVLDDIVVAPCSALLHHGRASVDRGFGRAM